MNCIFTDYTLRVVAILLVAIVPAIHGEQINVEQFEFNDQLNSRFVFSVFQDSNKFIWIGTAGGLNFYDGHQLKSFDNISDDATFSDDYVLDIDEDANGDIWFVTAKSGIARYSYSTNSFKRYFVPSGESEAFSWSYYHSIVAYEDSIWLGGNDHMLRFKPETGEKTRFALPTRYPVDLDSLNPQLRIWPEQQLALMLIGGTLYHVPLHSGSSPLTPLDSTLDVFEEGGIAGYSLAEGELFILSDSMEMYILDPGHSITRSYTVPEDILKNGPTDGFKVSSMLHLSDGTQLITTNRGLLLRSGQGRWKYATFDRSTPDGLTTNKINAGIQDHLGHLWLATDDGIQHYNRNVGNFLQLNYQSDDDATRSVSDTVYGFASVPGYGLITVVQDKGLAIVDTENNALRALNLSPENQPIGDDEQIKSLGPVAGGYFWIPTYSGLLRIDLESGSIRRYSTTDDGHELVNMRQVLAIDDTTLLFALRGTPGLVTLDIPSDTMTFEPLPESSDGEELDNFVGVYDVYMSRGDVLWIAAYNYLVRYDPGTGGLVQFTQTIERDGIERDLQVQSIAEAEDGTVWLASRHGLYAYENGELSNRLKLTSQSRSAIYSLIFDDLGRLWLGSNHGLILYDPLTDNYQVLTETDGLPFSEFNIDSAAKLPDGRIVLAGIDGVVLFDPAEFTLKPESPSLALVGVEHGGKPFDFEGHPSSLKAINLEPSDTFVSLVYSLLDFHHSGEYKLQYRINNYRDKWTDMGDSNRLDLINLPPGDFNVTTRVVSKAGREFLPSHSITVSKAPTFYQTKLFMALLVIAGIGLLLTLYKLRTGYVRRESRHLEAANKNLQRAFAEKERAEEELQESEKVLRRTNEMLNNKIAEVTRLNEELQAFNYSVSNVLKVPIRHLLGYSEILTLPDENWEPEKRREMINKIAAGAKELNRLVDSLALFAQLKDVELHMQTIDLGAIIREKKPDELHEERWQQIELIVQPGMFVRCDRSLMKIVILSLLEFSIEQTNNVEGARIIVDIIVDRGQKWIRISDNGCALERGTLEKLFKPFHAFHTIGNFKGTGMAMPTVRRIIQRHGGEIVVRPVQGGGCEFLFTLGPDDSWLIRDR